MKKLFGTLALSGLTLLTLAGPAAAAHEGTAYQGSLSELNGSGGSGEAYVEISEDGETMTVGLDASGLNLDGPHAMHIHGLVDGDDVQASTCPTMDADADGDGVLTVLEGVPSYGGIQVSLTTEGDTSPDSALAVERFPAGTSFDYERSGIPIPENIRPAIAELHVVVHGIDENGNGTLDMDQEERSSLTDDLPREGTAPALCGTLTAVAGGEIQTGAGGMATSDSTTMTAGVASLAGVSVLAVAAAVALRRRPSEG
jgi:hypothetical protein